MLSHHVFDILAGVVLTCSILSFVLPPYEVFSFSPRFQGVYRVLLVFVIQIGSLNLRSLTMKLYPSYKNGGTNDSKSGSVSTSSVAS
jgi:hypothetical protein